jgi:hypothetical protein
LEAGLGEVLIVGQGGLDVLRFHGQEAGAVRKAPILVSPFLISAERPFELIARLGYHHHVGVALQSFDGSRSCGAEARSTVAKPVQAFHQDHFAGDNLIVRILLGGGDRSTVKFIAGIEKRDTVTGVRENALHEVTLEVP